MLSLDRANALLNYDSDTGFLSWNISPSNNIKPGKRAGTISRRGYLKVKIGGKSYPAHHLVWLLANGSYPESEIDHIDGDKLNNRISNLRLANRHQNNTNVLKRKDNTSGFKGVTWRPKRNKWAARISINGKRKNLGHYETKEEAAEAYIKYSLAHHGEFSPFNNRNIPR